MRRPYSDHTSERAIGSVNDEWRRMAKLALIVRQRNASPIWLEQQEAKFTGIFKRLLEDPIEEVQREAGR